MDVFEKKIFKVARGYNYSYYVSPKSQKIDSRLPAILLVHGFPDDAHLWQYIVPRLLKLPFRIIVPDCLGYAGTDKPSDPAEYTHKKQTQDFMEILDFEGIDKVISIGHDWGSAVAQRVYLFHPDRVAALVLLNVAYIPPSNEPFDLDTVNRMSEKAFGYSTYAYWELFTTPGAHELLNSNPDRLWNVLHTSDEDWMRKMWCSPGAMKKYLEEENDQSVPLKEHGYRQELKGAWLDRVRSYGLEAPINYYKAQRTNKQYEAEKELLEGNKMVIKAPVLFIGCVNDPVCRLEMNALARKAGLLPDVEEVILTSGHWSPFEVPDQISDAIESWLANRFSS